MTIVKIISGGQSGADLGGVLAAKMHGLQTGGWMPRGWKTHYGPKPEYEELFNMIEHQSEGYYGRTWKNVEESDATIRIAKDFNSPGELCTMNAIRFFNKIHYDFHISTPPCITPDNVSLIVSWIQNNNIQTLNIAGNSHKTWTQMQSFTICLLSYVFFNLGFPRISINHNYWRLVH